MKNIFTLFFVVCFLLFSQNTYANEILDSEESVVISANEEESQKTTETTEETTEAEEPVTIKEMKENLEWLKDKKDQIDFKWDSLNSVNGKVVDFLKSDLTEWDIAEIEVLSLQFQEKKAFYDLQLKNNSEKNSDLQEDDNTEIIKDEFIQYKLSFYKELVPFIDVTKKESYLSYIKWNIGIEKENKDIKEKIYKQEEVIEDRVDIIKEKIKVHKEELEKKLEMLIREKIAEKLDVILNSETIIILEDDKKIFLLEQVIDRLVLNKQALVANNEPSELLNQKVAIYNIAAEIIQEKITSLK